jgi:hypothetical protein
MKSDNYFEIGTSHEICQDYAISGAINDNISYAIVADGCTMSHKDCGQVDLGARILAHSAKDVLKRIWEKETQAKTESLEATSKFLRERSIIMTRMIERQLDLPPLFADCTLLVAIADNMGNAHSFIYGDGSVFVRLRHGYEEIVDITFLSGAPLYLSYQTDPARKQGYMAEFGECPVIIDRYVLRDEELYKKNAFQIDAKDPLIYDKAISSWEGVELISVTSDGANSYLKHEEGEYNPVPYLSIMNEFNAFKNKKGVFVQRRMKAMGKSHKKEGIIHYDDISIAAIAME